MPGQKQGRRLDVLLPNLTIVSAALIRPLPIFSIRPLVPRLSALTAMGRVGRLPESVRRMTSLLARSAREHEILEAAGFLPHHTTPFDLLEGIDDAEAAAARLDSYYAENWPAVRDAFRDACASYVVDEEAKLVFDEALAIHGDGRYRAVSRLLFPELERLATAAFPAARGLKGGPLGALREFAGDLDLDEINPGGFRGVTLFKRFDEHLYAPVNTEEEVGRARLDPVPNRHAAIHGRVSYASMRNSLNALIMADYVYQVTTLVALRRTQETGETASDAAAVPER